MSTHQFKLKDLRPSQDFIDWNESMSHKQDIDLYYEGSHPFIKWIEKLRLKSISNLIKNHIKRKNIKGPIIIEVGCGTGHVLEEIANSIHTKELIGIDLLEWWLDKAKQRLGNKAKLIKGFAEDLPFENQSVDFAICTEVIEHVIDPKVVLKELKRIVKKDGLIIVTIPNEKLINKLKDIVDFFKLYKKLFPNIPRNNEDEWHLHIFDLNLLKKYVREELKIHSIARIPFFFLPIRYTMTLSWE